MRDGDAQKRIYAASFRLSSGQHAVSAENVSDTTH